MRMNPASDSIETKYVTLKAAAARVGLSVKTLSNHVSDGRLTSLEGLRYVAGRRIIEWSVFEKAYVRTSRD